MPRTLQLNRESVVYFNDMQRTMLKAVRLVRANLRHDSSDEIGEVTEKKLASNVAMLERWLDNPETQLTEHQS